MNTPSRPARDRGLDPFLGIELLILICAQVSVFFSSDPTRLPLVTLSTLCVTFSALRLLFPFVRPHRGRIASLIGVEVAILVAIAAGTTDGAIIVLGIGFILRNAEMLAPRVALGSSIAGIGIALAVMIVVAIAHGADRPATIDMALALLMAIGVTGALATFATSERRALQSLRAAHDELRRYADHAAQTAAEHERTRIAAELHDAIGHALTALNVQLQSAIRLRDTRPVEADALIASALELGQGALASVRQTVSTLRNDPLERDSLDRVLQRIVARHETSDGPRIAAVVEPCKGEPIRATIAARIAEEALVNAIKHARARRVDIVLATLAKDAVRLEVRDDGCGFDLGEQASGHGLQIMRERAHDAGIDLALWSAPGNGTRVILNWQPLGAV